MSIGTHLPTGSHLYRRNQLISVFVEISLNYIEGSVGTTVEELFVSYHPPFHVQWRTFGVGCDSGWEWNEISLINICQTSLWKVFQSNTLWMSEKRLHFCFPPTHEEWWPAASRMTTQCLFSTYRLALIRFTVRSELLHRPPFGGEQMISNSLVSGAPRFNNRHCSTWSSNFALGGWLGNCAKSRSTATYWPPWKQRFRICGPKRFN